MKLFKFKNFISNTIADSIFENVSIYEENLYSKDSSFSVSPIDLSNSNKEDLALYQKKYKESLEFINSLSKSPEEEDVLKNNFAFAIHFDAISVGTGVSLKSLVKISKKLHSNFVFINGDGNDYQLGEFTSGHDSEVIIHIQFIGDKKALVKDYQDWYLKREKFLSQKIQDKLNKNRIKR